MSAEAIASSDGAPATSRKLAARVAKALEDDVIAAGWRVGSLLGSEAALMQRYGVSRAILREAVRLVEHHGVATMRRGPNGGLVVLAPAADAAVNAMVVFLEYCNTTVEDLSEARSILEPLIAGMAAERVTEADIAALRQRLAREREDFDRSTIQLDSVEEIHLAIADVTGNPVLRLFIEVLARLTNLYATGPRRTREDIRSAGVDVHRAHEALVEAIISGDAELARHRARAHAVAIGEWFRTKRTQRLTAKRRRDHERVGVKLAESTAWSIRADILDGEHGAGSVVGSEKELLERYDVSRAVLREAIRLLEHHSVARMRRGPGGGLVVTEPDPSASIEAMALYLEYRGVAVPAVRETRLAIEIACVDMVTERRDAPGVREQLLAGLELDAHTPAADIAARSDVLHSRLCELAGNPVLSLFEQVLIAVWARHSSVPVTEELKPELVRAVTRAHEAIVEAILDGDASLARHRMTRHLTATTEWWQ